MTTLWISVLAALAGIVCGQNQDFDLSQFDFSGMNFGGNQPANNGPTQPPAGLAFSNQASGNNVQPPPMGSNQGNPMPMQNNQQPMLNNPQQQANQMAFPQQNQNMAARNQFQQPIQSSRVNTGSLTPEESWLTVGGSQMQNRNPALSGSVGNGMAMNPNGQPGFPMQNGFPQNGPQGGFPNNPQTGFNNQGGRFPPNQGPGGAFEQFGTPGNDMFTFNVNAMGTGPSDFSAFNNNPFAGTPFGEGINVDQNQFGNPNMRNPMNPFGRQQPQVSFIDPNDLPPSVRMAMNMNGRPVGGFMGPAPGGLPGLAGFTGFQPPVLTPIQQQSRGGIGGFLSRIFG